MELLLMRHGKSDWTADYESDHERPLNERGVRSSRLMGRVLARDGIQPELVICSTAVRAETTARLASEAGGWAARITEDSRLYGGGPDTVIEVVGEVPDDVRLMVLGHQPTWSLTVAAMTGEQVEMKTATVAVIDFDIKSWSQVSSTRGALRSFYRPRSYFGSDLDQG